GPLDQPLRGLHQRRDVPVRHGRPDVARHRGRPSTDRFGPRRSDQPAAGRGLLQRGPRARPALRPLAAADTGPVIRPALPASRGYGPGGGVSCGVDLAVMITMSTRIAGSLRKTGVTPKTCSRAWIVSGSRTSAPL